MGTTQRTLSDLNADTFRAENREGDWEKLMRDTLADDFVLRRANKARPDETREQAIEAIRVDTRRRELLQDTVRVWQSETVGVVTCVVELVEPPPSPEDRYFQNVKVFQARDGAWRCVHWQVSGKPAP
jgi:hypothetical protein